MYGDPDILRSRVDDLREQALDVRAMADHLVAKTDELGWSGRAADSMRRRIGERAGHLRAAASEHDTAANALLTHAQEVEMLQESIADIEHRHADLVAEASTRAAHLTTGASTDSSADSTELDLILLAFEAPPPGHRDWLDVEATRR